MVAPNCPQPAVTRSSPAVESDLPLTCPHQPPGPNRPQRACQGDHLLARPHEPPGPKRPPTAVFANFLKLWKKLSKTRVLQGSDTSGITSKSWMEGIWRQLLARLVVTFQCVRFSYGTRSVPLPPFPPPSALFLHTGSLAVPNVSLSWRRQHCFTRPWLNRQIWVPAIHRDLPVARPHPTPARIFVLGIQI